MAGLGAYTTHGGRLGAVLVNGAKIHGDLLEKVTAASLALSTQEVSTLTLTIADADVALLRRDVFAKRQPVDAAGLKLQVESRSIVDVGGLPGLQATCWPRVIARLRALKGTDVRHRLSPTTYIGMDVRSAGGAFVGQPSPSRSTIVRVHDSSTNETAFDVHVRLAAELGFDYFEAAGVVYFGKPSWLVRRLPAVPIRWDGRRTDGRLWQVPTMRDSDADNSTGTTGTLVGAPSLLEQAVPGRAVSLRGLGSYDGLYLATGLSMDLDGVTAATVEIAQPVDPVPQPPDSTAPPSKSASVASTSAAAGGSPSARAVAALQAARSVIGTPYRWGGAEPGGFDCSGLMAWAYGRAGLELPRTAVAQWDSGGHPDLPPGLALSKLRPGDLIFYAANPSRPSTIHHVAMYAGDEMMVVAPSTGQAVTLVKVYGTGYAGATRPAP